MSVKILSHVWNRSKAKSTALLVMLAIADCCNDDGFTWYSIANLSKKARVSPRTLQRSIAQLEHLGELRVFVRHADDSARNLSNVYMVVLPGATQELPEELRGSIEETPRDPAKMLEKTSLKEKLAAPPVTGDTPVTADTLPGVTDDIRSVNNRSVNKGESADKPRPAPITKQALQQQSVKNDPLWQAYEATFFAPPYVTQKQAGNVMEVIQALRAAGVKPEQLTAYMNKYEDAKKPSFIWLAERIPQIIAGRGGSKEQDELSRFMASMTIIGRDT